MTPPEFKYSSKAHYSHAAFKVKTVDIINQNIIVNSDGSFKVSFPNILEKYKLPYVESDALVNRWRTDWMQFWQKQLHFAVWCATTSCGVDFNHHLKAESIGSMFMFRVNYQIRRILKEINAALPQDASWNAFENSYDLAAYERICKDLVSVSALIGGKNRVTTKVLGCCTIAGQTQDIIRSEGVLNMTPGVIRLHNLLQMI